MDTRVRHGRAAVSLFGVFAVLIGAASSLLGTCGPFTDSAADSFCPFVLEVFYLGITTGTTPSTYEPTANVSRLQMAAFLSRTVDGVLKRGSRRAALDRFWVSARNETTVGPNPIGVKSDGLDIWVSDFGGGTVSRVRASDGRLLETWTGATNGRGLLTGAGFVVVTGATSPGQLYFIEARQPAGAVTTVATNLGDGARGIAFDGNLLWTANASSVSLVNLDTDPATVTTVTAGFNNVFGPVFDGSRIWVSNSNTGTLLKLDSAGAILQTVTVGAGPSFPMYDGANIWVPNLGSSSISIVRPSTGAVLATLTGNGLSQPGAAAFDGQRVLVTSFNSNNVSLWKAADLTPIGFFNVGGTSNRACSDGVEFWITLGASGVVTRF